jgi:hypothetical protein
VELSVANDIAVGADAQETLGVANFAARRSCSMWILGLALVATCLKLLIAYNTIGTNDAISFYVFARSLHDHGLQWTYLRGAEWLAPGPIFNHPPLTAYYLQFIVKLAANHTFESNGFTFPFLLRIPGIVADFIVVLAVLHISASDPRFRLPNWSLALFACSPVSLMVSGFHGNTDSVMVMFLVLAAVACLKSRATLCGILLGLSCQIKAVSYLFLPVFFFLWLHRHTAIRFLVSYGLSCIACCWEPLSKFPLLFVKNVLLYGSFWGSWGLTYWLRLTGIPAFSRVNFMNLSMAQSIVATVLKIAIIAAVFTIAWRRRASDDRNPIKSIGYAWVIFFALSPGVCPQYMVWLAPFALFLSPTFYGWLTAASSLFLCFFYNITAHGLPWFVAISKNELSDACDVWALWPWAVIVIAAVLFWKKATALDPTVGLFVLGKYKQSRS